MKRSRVLAIAFAAALASACATIVGVDELTIGDCKGGICADGGGTDGPASPGDAGPDGDLPPVDASVDSSGCPTNTQGPPMELVGTTGNQFCIDTTEVTVGDYQAFLAVKASDMSGMPATCSWKTTHATPAAGLDNVPQAGVDWCDAWAYCQWAGKRLCGSITNGKFTGPVAEIDLGNPANHSWYIACTAAGQLRFPYGSVVKPTACNLADFDAGKALPPRSLPGCEGGFPGLYDMLGNVWEWFDGPDRLPDGGTGADGGDAGARKDPMIVKGGAFNVPSQPSPTQFMDCRIDGRGVPREYRGSDIGFRCCAESSP